MSDSVRPHRRQPTRLCRPWDSPGKNTGVGCHCLLHCVKVKSESEVAQSRPARSDPMDCSLPGSFIRGIFKARVLEWLAIAFSAVTSHRDPYWRFFEVTAVLLLSRFSLSFDNVTIMCITVGLFEFILLVNWIFFFNLLMNVLHHIWEAVSHYFFI